MTPAQQRRKIKTIYRRWLEDEKFFDEIAVRPSEEFSNVTEVLRNLGSAIAYAYAMANAALPRAERGKEST